MTSDYPLSGTNYSQNSPVPSLNLPRRVSTPVLDHNQGGANAAPEDSSSPFLAMEAVYQGGHHDHEAAMYNQRSSNTNGASSSISPWDSSMLFQEEMVEDVNADVNNDNGDADFDLMLNDLAQGKFPQNLPSWQRY